MRALRANAALLAVLAACGGEPHEARPLRLATGAGAANASLLVALRHGYFEANGVAVQELRMNRPGASLPELARDQVDVAATAPSIALFNLIARGERLRVVADRGQHREGLCTRGAVLLRTGLDPDDLPRELRVSATTGYIEEFIVERAARLLGRGPDDWRVISVPTAGEAAAMATGGIDLLLANEPNLTRLQEAGLGTIWRTVTEIVGTLQSHLIVFGPRLLEREPELGERFLAAYLQVEHELARGATDANVERMADALDLDPGLVRRMCWTRVRDDLVVDFASLGEFQAWAAAQGLLDRVAEPSEYWDGRFAERAVARSAATSELR
jgi:ABC-type nitrate/sulfonate/bicarbonate transport system substrate-binding protein